MARLTAVKLLVGEVIGGGVYSAGDIVYVAEDEARALVEQEKAEYTTEIHVEARSEENDELDQ